MPCECRIVTQHNFGFRISMLVCASCIRMVTPEEKNAVYFKLQRKKKKIE